MKDAEFYDVLLPQQIVEDEDGNMRVVPEGWLRADADGISPLEYSELGMENLENDQPWTDAAPRGEYFATLEDFREAMR